MFRGSPAAAIILGWLTLAGATGRAEIAQPVPPLKAKAAAIRIPKLEFREASLREAVNFLRRYSIQADPDRKGVNIVILAPPEAQEAEITLELIDVPLDRALSYIAMAASMKLTAGKYALEVRPVVDVCWVLVTVEYAVPKAFRQKFEASGCASMRRYLESLGLEFPAGAEVSQMTPEKLTMKNIPPRQDDLETLLTRLSPPEKPPFADDPAMALVIPSINVREASLSEVVLFLKARSQAVDSARKGVDIAVKNLPRASATRLDLELHAVPLPVVLQYVAQLAGCQLTRGADGFAFEPF